MAHCTGAPEISGALLLCLTEYQIRHENADLRSACPKLSQEFAFLVPNSLHGVDGIEDLRSAFPLQIGVMDIALGDFYFGVTKPFLDVEKAGARFQKHRGIRSRVRSGMANAKAKGKHIGRRPTTKDDIPAVFYKHYPTYMSGQMNVAEFARICGLSRPTVYKYMKMLKKTY